MNASHAPDPGPRLRPRPAPVTLKRRPRFLLARRLAGAAALAIACSASLPAQIPSGRLCVQILAARTSGGVDDDFLFFENQADVFGRVFIESEEFNLPIINGSDHPHWEEPAGVICKEVSARSVKIQIDLFEEDEIGEDGGETDTTQLDVSPDPASCRFTLFLDTCSLLISGDYDGPSQGVIRVTGNDASGEERATLWLTVRLEDGALTTDDLALTAVDLVQAVSETPSMVRNKPAVLMIEIANRFDHPVSTEIDVMVAASGLPPVVRTFDLPALAPGPHRRHFFVDDPLSFPECGEVVVTAQLDPRSDFWKVGIDEPCLRQNDSIGGNPPGLRWEIVATKNPRLLWAKTGTLLDASAPASDSDFAEIRRLGTPFIEAVFPAEKVENSIAETYVTTPGTAVAEFLFEALSVIGIPADGLIPFAMLFDLNGLVPLLDPTDTVDTMMGVLPDENWFRRFGDVWESWLGVSGLSLGEFAGHAVIFLPKKDSVPGSPPAPSLALPAHELCHTHGLSVDPRLKTGWGEFCSLDDPVFGPLICGAAGGLDEYNRGRGNPADGFWVRRGTEPPEFGPAMAGAEQSASFCLMGLTPQDAQNHWSVTDPVMDARSWIDAADYDALREALQIPCVEVPPSPGSVTIFVAGIIDRLDRVYLGPFYRLENSPVRAERPPGSPGHYAFRFVDEFGATLSQTGIPMRWHAAGTDGILRIPLTFISLYLEMPAKTAAIEVWNLHGNTMIAHRLVSANPPEVKWLHPVSTITVPRGETIALAYEGLDLDNDPLEFSLFLRRRDPNNPKQPWSPLAHRLAETTHPLDTAELPAGHYDLRVVAADGVHLAEALTTLEVTPPCLPPDPGNENGGSVQRIVVSGADTTISTLQPDNPFGDRDFLVVSLQGEALLRSLVRFDLSAIPAGSTVLTARLAMTPTFVGGPSDPVAVRVHSALAPWEEETTWNSGPEPGPLQATVVVVASRPAVWDLTALTQSWLAGTTPNYGLLLTPDFDSNIQVHFASRESTGPLPPRLIIDYLPPEPAPDPLFRVTRSNRLLLLTWPAQGGEWHAETSSNLDPFSWSPLATPPDLVGSRFCLPVVIDQRQAFFRLQPGPAPLLP